MSAFKLRKEKDCLNCGKVVEENFCPHCGQENIVVKENAFHMVSHAIADYFHFEHKFFGTINPLLFKPGKLTSAYVAGKRVAFIHPIRLYIFISIVFFLVVLSGKKFDKNSADEKTKHKTTKVTDSLKAEKFTAIEDRLKYIPNEGGLRDSLIKEAKTNVGNDGSVKLGSVKKKKITSSWSTQDTTIADYLKHQATLSKDKRDSFIKQYIIKRNIELNEYENPEIKLLEDLLHNIPKMMFYCYRSLL